MQATTVIDQTWLINQQNICGEKYEVDANGDLIPNTSGMYIGSIVDYSLVTVILGLYIGQVAFRYFGAGRLT